MRLFTFALIVMFITTSGVPVFAATPPSSFADMVEPRLGAVVNISTTQRLPQARPMMPGLDNLPNDPQLAPFRELFRQFQQQHGGGANAPKATSLGSGFVISADGFVVTNNHVIAQAESVSVTFHDDTKLPAKIIGRDAKTDLALLKVESKKPLNFVNFGDSDSVRVGDWVIAVGNPFGLGGSVSAGIVSARGRNINAGPFDDFIQTDAAINRGNSGGPLFNAAGEVVGINSAIFSPTGGSVGIGFAVPSSLAEPVIKQLREKGRAQRAWLGVRIQEVSDEIAKSLGLKSKEGALVQDIDPKGPAYGSGIVAGDVIVSFDGKAVKEMRSLPRMVADTPIGKNVPVTVWRGGKTHDYTVRLTEVPADDQPQEAAPFASGAAPAGDLILGAQLLPINRDLRAQYRIADNVTGLLVAAIEPRGTLARVGVRPGDIIRQINQIPVENVSLFKREVDKAVAAKRDAVLIRVQRGANAQFVTVLLDGVK